MISTNWEQFQVLLWSLLGGFFAGFVYDIFRIRRKVLSISDFFTHVEDILFFIITALIVFFVAYTKNNGEIRWFEFFGVGTGFILYRMIFKNFIMNLSIKVINIVIKILMFILKVVFFPIALIYKILRKPFRIILWYTSKGIKKTKMLVKIRKSSFAKKIKDAKNI